MAAKKSGQSIPTNCFTSITLLCMELPFSPDFYAAISELCRIIQQNYNSYSIHYSNEQEKISATDLAMLWHCFQNSISNYFQLSGGHMQSTSSLKNFPENTIINITWML